MEGLFSSKIKIFSYKRKYAVIKAKAKADSAAAKAKTKIEYISPIKSSNSIDVAIK